jgi:hypothetical protein
MRWARALTPGMNILSPRPAFTRFRTACAIGLLDWLLLRSCSLRSRRPLMGLRGGAGGVAGASGVGRCPWPSGVEPPLLMVGRVGPSLVQLGFYLPGLARNGTFWAWLGGLHSFCLAGGFGLSKVLFGVSFCLWFCCKPLPPLLGSPRGAQLTPHAWRAWQGAPRQQSRVEPGSPPAHAVRQTPTRSHSHSQTSHGGCACEQAEPARARDGG